MRWFHIILVSVVLCACGCGTIRKSAMYGDGTAYVPVSQDRIHRKFYIRDIAVKNWPGCNVGLFNNVPDLYFKGPTISVSPESISRFVPELIREKPLPGDVAVDLEVKFVDDSTSGFWTIPLAFTLVLPCRITQDWSFDVKITVGQEKVPLPAMSSKLQLIDQGTISPLGQFYDVSKPEGYQLTEACSVSSPADVTLHYNMLEILNQAIAYGVGQQLSKHALDRVTIPDVEFGEE